MAKKKTAWQILVAKTYAAGKAGGMSYRQAMVEAKKNYRKGGDAAPKKKVRRKRRAAGK